MLDGALSGGVTVNGTLLRVEKDGLTFGGVGPSGVGAYHGHHGSLHLTHARAIYEVGFPNAFERLGPPWGRLAATTAKLLTLRR